MNMMDFIPSVSREHSLLFSIDATHPRDYPEYLMFGSEYAFLDMFFVRAGYVSNRDEEDLTYGFGIRQFGIGFDDAYTPFGVFDNVQRFSLSFIF
jgi:hypothetical protein